MKIKFFLETLQYFSLKDRYLILLLITLMIFGALLEIYEYSFVKTFNKFSEWKTM